MEQQVVDCIIIGSGMAGISAALTLQANRKSFLIFGSAELSDKIAKAEKIHNYPGFNDVSGAELVDALKTQLKAADIAIIEEKVTGVYALKEKFAVLSHTGKQYESHSVILATGVESIRLIEGEEKFSGRGVSYCATCDGFLYKGKTIAVLCTSKRLEHEIGYLADFAEKVYLIPMYKNVEIARANITKIMKMPKSIEGNLRANKLVFSEPPSADIPSELPIDGVFMLRESVSPAVLVGGLQVEDGHVVVDRNMATNLAGCYAAGDCTGRPYQYAKAVGDGNVAAHAVTAYLANRE